MKMLIGLQMFADCFIKPKSVLTKCAT